MATIAMSAAPEYKPENKNGHHPYECRIRMHIREQEWPPSLALHQYTDPSTGMAIIRMTVAQSDQIREIESQSSRSLLHQNADPRRPPSLRVLRERTYQMQLPPCAAWAYMFQICARGRCQMARRFTQPNLARRMLIHCSTTPWSSGSLPGLPSNLTSLGSVMACGLGRTNNCCALEQEALGPSGCVHQ
eukprot:1749501-Pyramimonas_sp.AAC.1